MFLGEIPFHNGAARRAKLLGKGNILFVPNSTAMMNHNRQMTANRSYSTTLSRDINGAMNGFGEDVVETSYGPEKSWKDLVLGDIEGFARGPHTTASLRRQMAAPREPVSRFGVATRWNRQHRLGSHDIEGLGDATNWGEDLLSIVKNALPIYQQQQVFKQQLAVARATGAPVVVNTPAGNVVVPPVTNWGKMALLGGGGLAAAFLLFKVMKRR